MTFLNRRWTTFSLCLAAILSGCSSDIGKQMSVRSQIKDLTTSTAEMIDLSQVGSSAWSRLCVLTPYSTNKMAKDILEFEWDAEAKMSIASNDGITLLVFASDDEVDTHVSYPRGDGDFSSAESACLSRDRAKFVRKQDDSGWVSFVAAE